MPRRAIAVQQQQPAVCPAMFSGGGSSKPKKAVRKPVGKPAAKASQPLSALFGSKPSTAKKPVARKVAKKPVKKVAKKPVVKKAAPKRVVKKAAQSSVWVLHVHGI